MELKQTTEQGENIAGRSDPKAIKQAIGATESRRHIHDTRGKRTIGEMDEAHH